MVFLMVYNPTEQEWPVIREAAGSAAALLTDEKWQMDFIGTLQNLDKFLKDQPLMDIACYDVAGEGSIQALEHMRKSYRDALLLIIAGPELSPMEYIRPTILASSLLIRPMREEQLRSCFWELTQRLKEKTGGDGQEEQFVVETREGKTFVPLSKVYYFEAREKKIYIRLRTSELSFYETIEHLEKRLPERFIRCHRSFIINRDKLERVMLSKGVVALHDGMEVPLSRSYKPVLKDLQ